MTAHLSSRRPAGSHPSVEELADLAEGLVEPAAAAEAMHRHLDGCADCRATVDALGEVQSLLGALAPEPMPADVAARLDAALAQTARPEAAHIDAGTPARASGAEAPADAAASADTAGTPDPAAVTDPAGPAEAADAARSLQKAVGDPHRASAPAPSVRPATRPSAPPSRPATAAGPGRAHPRRRRRAGLLLGAATALAALGLGGALLLAPSTPNDRPAITAGAPASTSAAEQSARTPRSAGPGTAYQDDGLAAQIQQLLARAGTAPGPGATGHAKSDAAAPAEGLRPQPDSPTAAASPTVQPPSASCPPPAPGTPLATDRGSYRGAPVEVLVYPSPGRPGFVDVYFRSPDCGPVVSQQSVPEG
ncbi:hypothetical protein ACGF07_06605 [Kitasatospora sp. NPDC048194]|uniref:hypothetical protein n=1 Tax=Kitasatospora sp. NPDC048194 TaxID=3364045 RepID=UPI0037153AB2